jgi:hypothetical protein
MLTGSGFRQKLQNSQDEWRSYILSICVIWQFKYLQKICIEEDSTKSADRYLIIVYEKSENLTGSSEGRAQIAFHKLMAHISATSL